MGVNEKQARALLFVHVPKTAGTSIRVLALRQYQFQPAFVISHDIQAERERLAAYSDAEKRALRLVFGHMEWGWHELLPENQPYAYATMLRDPIERVLSLYAHCILPEHYLGPATQGMDLAAFLTSGVTCTADNGMVRQLCGRDRFLQAPGRDMAIPFGGVTEADLQAAIWHLDQCAVVGLSEQFDRFLDKCRLAFGWRPMSTARRENVTRWPRLKLAQLDKRALDILEHSTRLDRVLYEHARGLA